MRTIDIVHGLARDNGGLLTHATARTNGIPSQRLSDLVCRGVLARVARGVYAVAGTSLVPPDPRAVTLGWKVVLSFESAAAWWGIDLPAAPGRLHVTAPRSRGRWRDAVPGIRLHRATLRRGEVMVVRGVPVTSPVRTALDIGRHASLEHAVAVVDAFYRARLMTAEEFCAAVACAAGPGRVRLQRVAMLADPASGSILESLTRTLLWRHRLAPEATQFSFKHPRTGWVGYLDFAWPSRQAALECDGFEWHRDRQPFQRDRRRWSALNRAGWRCAVVTWFDVTGDPAYVVALVQDLLAEPRAS